MKTITVKVSINPDKLTNYMRSRDTSMVTIGANGVYSAKTIQRGLKDRKMTADLVSYLSYYLGISPRDFADVDKYLDELKRFIFNWEMYKDD